MILFILLMTVIVLLTRGKRLEMVSGNNPILFVLCLLPFLAIGAAMSFIELLIEFQTVYDLVTFGG